MGDFKIKDLAEGLRNVNVMFKIIERREPKTVNVKGQPHQVCDFIIADETGSIIMPIWDEKIFEIEGKIGLVFGREDNGLYNNEIALCDIMVKIPSSESYPSLNLSHAVNIVLYSIYIRSIYQPKKKRIIGKTEKEKLFSFFYKILDDIDYPKHKKENTNLMFRRIMGRAMPSKWEYHTLMGVLSKTLEKIRKNQ